MDWCWLSQQRRRLAEFIDSIHPEFTNQYEGCQKYNKNSHWKHRLKSQPVFVYSFCWHFLWLFHQCIRMESLLNLYYIQSILSLFKQYDIQSMFSQFKPYSLYLVSLNCMIYSLYLVSLNWFKLWYTVYVQHKSSIDHTVLYLLFCCCCLLL